PEARSACAPWVSRWAEVAEWAAARSVALPGEMGVVVAVAAARSGALPGEKVAAAAGGGGAPAARC
ncbi:MAG: hypothetical protein ACRDY3_07895, partial [Acidimicrobiales bacterium]